MGRMACLCLWMLLSASALALTPDEDNGLPISIPPLKDPGKLAPVDKLKSPGSMYNPGGSNVGRNAHTKAPPGKSTHTPDECRAEADHLRNEYKDWDAQSAASATGKDLAAEDQKQSIREAMSDLAQACGGWDALGAPAGAGKSGNANSGAGAGSGDSGGGGGGSGGGGGGSSGSKTPTPPSPAPIGGPNAAAILNGGFGTAVPTKPVARPVPRGLATMLVRDQSARSQLREAWKQVAMHPGAQARFDTDNVAALSDPKAAPALADASELARSGLDSAAQIAREASALNAYRLSLARFRGALEKGDQAGVTRQAELMLKFIDVALESAKSGALAHAHADQLLLAELERLGANANDPPRPKQHPAATLSPEALNELKSAGVAAQAIAQLQQQLSDVTPEKVDAGIKALRQQLKAEQSSSGAPRPADVATLEGERRRARQLAARAGVALASGMEGDRTSSGGAL